MNDKGLFAVITGEKRYKRDKEIAFERKEALKRLNDGNNSIGYVQGSAGYQRVCSWQDIP